MSLPKIGGTLVLDNEAQFKKALAEVNAGLRVSQSQLKLVEEQSKKSGDAQAGLQGKMEALTGAINGQKEKIDILEKALQRSAEKTGEGSRQTMAWQEKLNYARRDLVKMETELQGYQQNLQQIQQDQQKAGSASADFGQALAEVNQRLRANQSQLELLEQQSKRSGDAQAALKSKIEALSTAITSQKDKISLLEKAMAASTEETGENSRQTLEWQEKLNYARRDLAKMEDELQGYQKEQKDTEKSTSSFGDKLKDLAKKLGVEVPEGAEKGKLSLDDVKTAALGVTAAVGGVVMAITGMTREVGQNAEQIKNNSQTMGMSAAQYQEWDYIFKAVGYSAEQASGDFAALAEKAKDAAEGTGEGAEVFDALGISVTKAGGQLKTQSELFSEVITKLQNMDDTTRRNALASQLLGTTGEELVPILNMTGQQLEELRGQAYETGSVMSDAAINDFAIMNQSAREMEQRFAAAKTQLALQFMPVLTDVFELISSIPTPVLATIGVIGGLISVFGSVTKAIYLMSAANTMLSGTNTAVGTTAMFAGTGMTTMVLGLLAILAVVALLTGASMLISNKAKEIENQTAAAQSQLQGMQQSVPKYAVGTRSAKKGFAIVGEQGPELVQMEGGERVYTAAQTRRILGGASYTDNRTFIFKVDDIETYQKIMDRAKREQMQIRQGFVGG